MVLTTTTDAPYVLYEGTAADVLGAIDGLRRGQLVQFGHNGTAYFALCHTA